MNFDPSINGQLSVKTLSGQTGIICKSSMYLTTVSSSVLPDKFWANLSSIYFLIQERRIHFSGWGTNWEDSDHEWWLANGICSLPCGLHQCRPAMIFFTFPKFQHGREVFSLEMDQTRNCEIRTSWKKLQFLKLRPPDPLLKTTWQLILINERRYMLKKWPSCTFFPVYIHWNSLQLSILELLTLRFEPKNGQSYQHDSKTSHRLHLPALKTEDTHKCFQQWQNHWIAVSRHNRTALNTGKCRYHWGKKIFV